MGDDLYTTMCRMGPMEDDETVSVGDFYTAATREGGNITNIPYVHVLRAEGPRAPSNDFHTLHSTPELSFSQELQISQSTLSPEQTAPVSEIWWPQDVLEGFSNLANFSPAEAAAVCPFLRSPPDGQLVQVREFLVAFHGQQAALLQLRELAQKLKDLNRKDVVMKMREQRSLLRWLGPVLPEELLIRDMKISHRLNFTTALSVTDPAGNDWRRLADMLSIPRHHAELWQEQDRDPAEMVLKTWEVKVTEATTGRLFDLMMDMNRGDLAVLL